MEGSFLGGDEGRGGLGFSSALGGSLDLPFAGEEGGGGLFGELFAGGGGVGVGALLFAGGGLADLDGPLEGGGGFGVELEGGELAGFEAGLEGGGGVESVLLLSLWSLDSSRFNTVDLEVSLSFLSFLSFFWSCLESSRFNSVDLAGCLASGLVSGLALLELALGSGTMSGLGSVGTTPLGRVPVLDSSFPLSFFFCLMCSSVSSLL